MANTVELFLEILWFICNKCKYLFSQVVCIIPNCSQLQIGFHSVVFAPIRAIRSQFKKMFNLIRCNSTANQFDSRIDLNYFGLKVLFGFIRFFPRLSPNAWIAVETVSDLYGLGRNIAE